MGPLFRLIKIAESPYRRHSSRFGLNLELLRTGSNLIAKSRLLWIPCLSSYVVSRISSWRYQKPHFLAAAFLASMNFKDLLLFLMNFGSQPLSEAYLFLGSLPIPCLCAFLVWLWAVWFFDLAIWSSNYLEYLQFI